MSRNKVITKIDIYEETEKFYITRENRNGDRFQRGYKRTLKNRSRLHMIKVKHTDSITTGVCPFIEITLWFDKNTSRIRDKIKKIS